jgi:hypothetical protein
MNTSHVCATQRHFRLLTLHHMMSYPGAEYHVMHCAMVNLGNRRCTVLAVVLVPVLYNSTAFQWHL